MPEQDVVVLGQEAGRRGRVGVGPRRVGQVEQLAAVGVTERREGGSDVVDGRPETGHARPRTDVGEGRRPERGQVASDPDMLVRRAVGWFAQPGLHRRPGDGSGSAPHAARRHLDEREVGGHRVGHRLLVAVRPALREPSTEGRATQRSVGQDLATGGDERLDVDVPEAAGERARGEPTGQRGLRPGSQRERVARGHEVDGRAHQRGSDRPTVLDRRSELAGVEAVQPRPEPDVRRQRRLRLHANEVLDLVEGGRGHAFEQVLAGEQGAVEGARSEHRPTLANR